MVDIWNKTKQNVNGIKLLVEIQVILDSVYGGAGAGGGGGWWGKEGLYIHNWNKGVSVCV